MIKTLPSAWHNVHEFEKDAECIGLEERKKEKSMTEKEKKTYTKEEWLAEGKKRFGAYFEDYKFRCPRCGNVASGQEFKTAGANPNAMYCECIGRYVKGKGCDWAAYGLVDICTVHVDGQPVFEFGD